MSKKTCYVIVMVLGVLMNEVLYELVSVNALNLPIWLDVSGTAMAAILLEPTAGLLVGLANNFFLAIFAYHDSGTLIYYTISAAVALIAGLSLRKGGKLKITMKGVLKTIGYVIVVSTVLAGLLGLWKVGVEPNDFWENYFYHQLVNLKVPQIVASFGGIGIVKTMDTFCTAGVIALIYMLFPKKLKAAIKKINQ